MPGMITVILFAIFYHYYVHAQQLEYYGHAYINHKLAEKYKDGKPTGLCIGFDNFVEDTIPKLKLCNTVESKDFKYDVHTKSIFVSQYRDWTGSQNSILCLERIELTGSLKWLNMDKIMLKVCDGNNGGQKWDFYMGEMVWGDNSIIPIGFKSHFKSQGSTQCLRTHQGKEEANNDIITFTCWEPKETDSQTFNMTEIVKEQVDCGTDHTGCVSGKLSNTCSLRSFLNDITSSNTYYKSCSGCDDQHKLVIDKCELCAPGQDSKGLTNPECTVNCPGGKYYDGNSCITCKNQTECEFHDSNICLNEFKHCQTCKVGYKVNSSGMCEKCPEGNFGNGQTCTPCIHPLNCETPTASCLSRQPTLQCAVCETGYYLDNQQCKNCDLGHYCPSGILTKCTIQSECHTSNNMTQCVGDRTKLACEVCNTGPNPGYKLENGLCAVCSYGQYGNGTICTSCKFQPHCRNQTNVCYKEFKKCSRCIEGYQLNTTTGECKKCEKSEYSVTGLTCKSCQKSNCQIATTPNECLAQNSNELKCDLASNGFYVVNYKTEPCKIGFHCPNGILTNCTEQTNCQSSNTTVNCINGEYSCQLCKAGAKSQGGICVDGNQCMSNKHNCDFNTTVCLNKNHGFECASCNYTAFSVDSNSLLTKKLDSSYQFSKLCRQFDLSGLKIQRLEHSLFSNNSFPNLNFLDLTNNNITRFNVGFLKEVRNLVLGKTLLLDLKSKCSIIGFDLDDKGLLSRKLGKEFDWVKYCKELDLSSYNITSLTDGMFDDMRDLTFMDLSNNSLFDVPLGIFDHIGISTEIKVDHVTRCRLSFSVGEDGVLNFNKNSRNLHANDCTTLNLQNTGLTKIAPSLFVSFKLLNNINLSKNNLVDFAGLDLPSLFYKKGSEIATLDLSYNKFVNVTMDMFHSFTSLRNLKLNNNQIKNIEMKTQIHVLDSSDLHINFTNNLISCCENIVAIEMLVEKEQYLNCKIYNNSIDTKDVNIADNTAVYKSVFSTCTIQQHSMALGNANDVDTGVIIGSVVGVLALLALGILLGLYIFKRKRKRKDLLNGLSAVNFVLDNKMNEYETINNSEETARGTNNNDKMNHVNSEYVTPVCIYEKKDTEESDHQYEHVDGTEYNYATVTEPGSNLEQLYDSAIEDIPYDTANIEYVD